MRIDSRVGVIACASMLLAAPPCSADITITLSHQTFTGFQFSPTDPEFPVGTLTGATINVILEASVAYTYADDFCVYLDSGTFSTGGAVQIGGFSNLQAAQRYYWPNGGSDAVGTTCVGTVPINPIFLDGSNLRVWFGNGYGAAGTSGTWSGTITLHGVNRWNCTNTPFYRDTDADGIGSAADGVVYQCWAPPGYADLDGDNCPTIPNPDQTDANANGLGDACEFARGDLNLDGIVNASDIPLLLNAWGTAGPIGDLNRDGAVNSADFSLMLNNWGTTP